jgi:septum formation protein
MFEDKHIVLASSSPRRRELLARAEITFTVKVSPVEEDFPRDLPLREIPEYLARKKALATQRICRPEAFILAADTIVLLEDRVIGKPRDEDDAKEILMALSGKAHEVITGVCLLQGDHIRKFSETTKVYFYDLSPEQISHYTSRYQPLDKAGAYGIQEWIGLTGIKKIEGDYFNVVGLPVGRVVQEIGRF